MNRLQPVRPFCTLPWYHIMGGLLALVPASLMSEPLDREEIKARAVSYYSEIRPVFQAKCHGCHQPAKPQGDYVMTHFEKMIQGGESGDKAILPGNAAQSHLVELITPVNGKAEMPRKDKPLSGVEIDMVRRWIDQGAHDDTPANAVPRYDLEHPPVYTRPPLVTSLDFSSDGVWLAISGFHEVLLHRADGSGLDKRLIGLSQRIESVRFSPDGSKLAVAGGSPGRMGELQIWDVTSGELDLSVPISYDTVYGVSWSPDGRLVALGCSDNTLRAFLVEDGQQVLFQGSHNDWVIDTVFSVKGDHVVSVGRDQTAKLTEVETERFIDNITSITPGALRGGIQSVARHPKKDEILIGASDGTPQIYRMMRQTKRVIGDNANLVRKYEPMTGRIFGVDFSSDGARIAGVSSLDGKGYVKVYTSDIDSSLSDELKGIMQKVASSRNAEERQKVEAFWTQGANLISEASFDTALYAVAFHPDGSSLVVGGADGIVRVLGASTLSLRQAFVPVPLKDGDPDGIYTLSVSPANLSFTRAHQSTQLLVQAWTASGQSMDVTRSVSYHGGEAKVAVSASGAATPLGNGEGTLLISHAGHQLKLPVYVDGQAKALQPDFVVDVNPVISKMGCNAGTCHGAKDGKNGFKLSLRGYDPLYDVRAFTDDLAGRRINFASPDDSLMLLKSTSAVPHEGGQRTRIGEPFYEILKEWIAQGCVLNQSSPKVASIEVIPQNPVVQSIGDQQQLRVVAHYPDGSHRDVTREAFVETSNGEVATVDGLGLVSSLRRGEAPMLARYEGAYASTTVTVMGDRAGFEWTDIESFNKIDEAAITKWKRMRILPSGLCTDTEFARRIYLDLTGLPPSVTALRKFLDDPQSSRSKRSALIDTLIGNREFVDYWTNKWADLLQVNRKFLGAEGATMFRDWIRNEIKANTPYDQFARKILTAKGSNKDNPAASYYKILREPDLIMENTTHLFLATRFNCNKCHDHPFERWTQDQYYQMSAYFARVSLKGDPGSKDKFIGGTAVEGRKPLYEVVYEENAGEVTHLRTGQTAVPTFPYQANHAVETEDPTRRDALASWMTSPDNAYFAKSYVNRIWGYLIGVGLIEPLDDIRAGNPPSNPELLDWLTQAFIDSGFDTRHLIRTICHSRVYQLSIESNPWNEDDRINFSHAQPKRLPAEVLHDAIYFVTGSVPDFPGVPRGTRAVQLPDVGVKLDDGFLANLGRPVRESACECERSSELQLGSILSLVSGPTVDQAISDQANAIAELVTSEEDNAKVVQQLYWRILNRGAEETEIEQNLKVFGLVEQDHEEVVKQLAAYEKEYASVEVRFAAEREKRIADAKQSVRDYQEEIAPREAKLDAEQQEAVGKAKAALETHEAKWQERFSAWTENPDTGTAWHAMDVRSLSASDTSKLVLQRDNSVVAEGDPGKVDYLIQGRSSGSGITAIRLETLRHASLPKEGPGRSEDGNFVLSEIQLRWAPLSSPKAWKTLKLHKPQADFSQKNFPVERAIDGNRGENNGWAISPQMGRFHTAVFELKEPILSDEAVLLEITLSQQYQGGKHAIGHFRLSLTDASKDIDLGIPLDVESILLMAQGDRSEEQVKVLETFHRSSDKHLATLEKALADAKKPRPEDVDLTRLKARLELVSQPLPMDPTLKQLRRALELSSGQIKNARLTAAQDVAWALINNPSFLFNH
jgi:WD40 repeat protein/mono/diheme cytochrome c family protein